MSRIITIISFVLLYFASSAQLIVNQTGTVAQWVQNVLTGPGVTVSNVTYTGDLQSVATFTTGATATNLGISSGMILCTGNSTSVIGFAGGVNASSPTSGGSDPLLAALIPQVINDAAVLEFDFIPLSDTVKFRYIFGSEEYPEFVTSFNDVFGFFISGLNPSGGNYVNENVALLPGTTTAVSIYNINNGTTNTGPCVNCNYYVNNASGTTVAYDAFTTPLYAVFSVIPCFSYHIKLVIGDAGDAAYDSGVFLEANSFGSNVINLSTTTANSIDTISVEGCNDAIVNFQIPYVTSIDKTFYFGISGSATNGVDYLQIPSSVTILAGHDTASIVISPLLDGITEGIENIELVVATSACTYDTINIYIKDYDLINCDLPADTFLCNNESLTILSNVTGGYQPYSYAWSNGDTTSSTIVSPNTSTVYTLVVNDICNLDTSAQIIVNNSTPLINIVGDSVCIHDTAFIMVVADPSWTLLWSNGETTANISFPVSGSAYYSILATDTIGCSVTDSTFVKGFPVPLAATSADTTICLNYEAKLRAFGNHASYTWSNGQNQKNILVSPKNETRYTVTVTNSNNCWDTTSVTVDVLQVPTAVITSTIDTLCIGNQTELFAPTADEYLWSTGQVTPSIIIQPSQPTVYHLQVSNVYNTTRCSHDTTLLMNVVRCNTFYVPSAFTPNGDGLNDEFGVEGQFVTVDRFRLFIFNRYGEKIFSTINPTDKWDGSYNGEAAPTGVYTYIVEITETLREPYVLKGTVHLLK